MQSHSDSVIAPPRFPLYNFLLSLKPTVVVVAHDVHKVEVFVHLRHVIGSERRFLCICIGICICICICTCICICSHSTENWARCPAVHWSASVRAAPVGPSEFLSTVCKQFGEIQFTIRRNTIYHLDKYILLFGQIDFQMYNLCFVMLSSNLVCKQFPLSNWISSQIRMLEPAQVNVSPTSNLSPSEFLRTCANNPSVK